MWVRRVRRFENWGLQPNGPLWVSFLSVCSGVRSCFPPWSCGPSSVSSSRADSAGKAETLVGGRRRRRLLQLCVARESAPTGNLDPPRGRTGEARSGACGRGWQYRGLSPKVAPLTPLPFPRCWPPGPRCVFPRWGPRMQATTCAGPGRGSRAGAVALRKLG